jgi:hypothetical protein
MALNPVILTIYGGFLLVLLAINLLYLFQVFKYRLQGDASLLVVFIHISLVLLVLATSTLLLRQ